MMNKKIVCIGECLLEFSPMAENLFRKNYAGDAYNTAVYLKRQFEKSIDVSFMTGLGADPESLGMRRCFSNEGLDSSLIAVVPDRQPGLYTIANDENGERFFQYWRSSSAARLMLTDYTAESLSRKLSEFDLIYFTGITLSILDDRQRGILLSALDSLSGKITIAFDPNYRKLLWKDIERCRDCFRRFGEVSNIILSTIDDEVAVWNTSDLSQITKRWHNLGIDEVVIKLGIDGCFLSTRDHPEMMVSPKQKLAPVDTTGAGDSFAAGYLGARMTGEQPVQSAYLANRIAGKVIMHRGAIIPYTDWETLPANETA